MNISPSINLSFNAKIIPCRALDTTLEYAQHDALSGTKEGLQRASELYNNLRAIENDTKSEIFFIDTESVRFHPYLRLDGCIKLLGPISSSGEMIAKSVRNGINKLVNETHLKDQIKDEAKNTDLTKAFMRWL